MNTEEWVGVRDGGTNDDGDDDGETGRVVFVTQHFPPEQGGAASRIQDTTANLAKHGWDVTVLAPPPCYPFKQFERSWRRQEAYEDRGVSVRRLWTWQPNGSDPGVLERLPYFLLFATHAAYWLFRHRDEYDVLVTTTPPIFTGLAGLFGSLFAPWVVDVRDLWIDNAVELGYISAGGCAERLARGLQRRVLHRADRLLVTTPSLGTAVGDRYGDSLLEKALVVPNGVDTGRFRPAGEEPDDPVIVYAGTLGRAQDLPTVVRAMAHLEGRARLRLVGAGDAEADLRALATDLGVTDRVEFAGLVDRAAVPDVLHGAQVAVAPIKPTEELVYAMPTKVYEYLACGLPTVVMGRGELVRFAAGSGGCVHVESDPEELAGVFRSLLADPERRREMGAAGREEMVEQYDREHIAEVLSVELSHLLGETPDEAGPAVGPEVGTVQSVR
jgi:glycosyltransferase involved in cell wall biosynthesis